MRILAYKDSGGGGRSSDQLQRLGGAQRVVVTLGGPEAALGLAESVLVGQNQTERALVGHVDRVALVGGGRIDNLEELRSMLRADRQESPAGLLIKAYSTWGETFAARVTGDFALILWDEQRRRMLAIRDAFGVTPLVYRASKQGLWIASGIEQVLRTFESSPDLDDQMVIEYLLWSFKAGDSTFFRDVRRIPAGHVLIADSSAIRVERYWVPPFEEPRPLRSGNRETYYEEFQRLFVQSVERRLQPGGSLVIHVSGGLDSSSIAVAANSLVRRGKIPASSLCGAAGRYPGLPCDEEVFINAVARHVDFPVKRWDATRADPSDLTNPTIEGPGGRIVNIGGSDGDIAIAKGMKADAILSGTGGDQLGMFRGVIHALISRGEWSKAVRELLVFPDATTKARLRRLMDLVGQLGPISVQQWTARARTSVPTWLAPAWRRLGRDLAVAEAPIFPFRSPVHRETWTRISSQNTVRAVESLQGQAASVDLEYRFPFLDGDLVRFVLQFPYDFLPRPEPFARLHRDALRNFLPPSIAARHGKAEFTPALRNRVQNASDVLEPLFSNTHWVSSKYVDHEQACRLWRTATEYPEQATARDWRQVWAIATLEAWHRRVLRYHGAHD